MANMLLNVAQKSSTDCYFYYYSQCRNGSNCPFRHEPAARGREEVCPLWRLGQCFRPACEYRHMEVPPQRNRSDIPCFWETSSVGCKRQDCAFKHFFKDKQSTSQEALTLDNFPRYQFLTTPGLGASDHPNVASLVPSGIPIQRLTQDLIGGQSVDTASPKVEQILITPFDEESDQESNNGTPVKVAKPMSPSVDPSYFAAESASDIVTLKKKDADAESFVTSSTPDIDFTETRIAPSLGIKTLEEIQRERAIKSMMGGKTKAVKSTMSGKSASASKSAAAKEPLMASDKHQSQSVTATTRRVVIAKERSDVLAAEIGTVDRNRNVKERLESSPSRNIRERRAGSPRRNVKERFTVGPSRNVMERRAISPSCNVKERLAASPSRNIKERSAVGPSRSIKDRLAVGVRDRLAANPGRRMKDRLGRKEKPKSSDEEHEESDLEEEEELAAVAAAPTAGRKCRTRISMTVETPNARQSDSDPTLLTVRQDVDVIRRVKSSRASSPPTQSFTSTGPLTTASDSPRKTAPLAKIVVKSLDEIRREKQRLRQQDSKRGPGGVGEGEGNTGRRKISVAGDSTSPLLAAPPAPTSKKKKVPTATLR